MRRRERIISFVLLLIIGLYVGGSTLFIHTHNVDGRSIVHSHPFSGTPASHSHSTTSFDTISRLTSSDYVAVSTISVECSISTQTTLYKATYCEHYDSKSGSIHSLRAPPSLV
ncbi:MAG: hypothetical protein J6V55_07320 [Alistipes sp.]|nr:hypothetical protein [Alistipes sp.]